MHLLILVVSISCVYTFTDVQTHTHTYQRGQEILSKLKSYSLSSPCFLDVLQNQLPSACSNTDEDRTRLAISLTQCHLAKSGIPMDPCLPDIPLSECTTKLATSQVIFQTYTSFYLETQTLCIYVQSDLLQSQTRTTIQSLFDSLSLTSHALTETSQQFSDLQSTVTSTLDLASSISEVLDQGLEEARNEREGIVNGLRDARVDLADLMGNQSNVIKGLIGHVIDNTVKLQREYEGLSSDFQRLRAEQELATESLSFLIDKTNQLTTGLSSIIENLGKIDNTISSLYSLTSNISNKIDGISSLIFYCGIISLFCLIFSLCSNHKILKLIYISVFCFSLFERILVLSLGSVFPNVVPLIRKICFIVSFSIWIFGPFILKILQKFGHERNFLSDQFNNSINVGLCLRRSDLNRAQDKIRQNFHQKFPNIWVNFSSFSNSNICFSDLSKSDVIVVDSAHFNFNSFETKIKSLGFVGLVFINNCFELNNNDLVSRTVYDNCRIVEFPQSLSDCCFALIVDNLVWASGKI
ncbi:hypothetical protein P9112_000150 [Eukaryota sp. TZLM1-RC]